MRYALAFMLMGILSLTGSCNGSGASNEDFTQPVTWVDLSLGSLPMFGDEVDITTYLTTDIPFEDDDGDDFLFDILNDALSFQCHRSTAEIELEYCPQGVDSTTVNEFDEDTLNGILARALFSFYDLYPDNRDFETCESTIRSEEITGAVEFTPEEGSSLQLLESDLWDCFEERDGANNTVITSMFSDTLESGVFALTQYQLGFMNEDQTQNQVIEVYARPSEDQSDAYDLIAWNVSIYRDRSQTGEDRRSRVTAILNPLSRRFVAKFTIFTREAEATTLFEPRVEMVLLGNAGYDVVSEELVPGTYYLKTRGIDDENLYERTYCVDNQSPPNLNANCTLILEPAELFFDNAQGFFSTAGLFNFLDMNTEDQDFLRKFVDLFDAPTFINEGQLPKPIDFPTQITNNDDAEPEDENEN